MVTLPADVVSQYRAFSLYNSPYPAHERGCAIDLYPGEGAPSPVAGTVVDVRAMRAPSRPYAATHDHLVVIDTGAHLARLLHVEPGVAPGDAVAVGDSLGRLVRSGYFAPWVDNHIHLGFRPPDADPLRASGSLPVDVDVRVDPVPWDGTGRVVDRGETYVVLDAPGHPAPGRRFAGVAGRTSTARRRESAPRERLGAVDGGLPHYPGGGLLGGTSGAVSVAGAHVGTANGRTVTWDDVEVRVNGVPVTGISFAARRDRLGVKLVSWDGPPADRGERVEVTVG